MTAELQAKLSEYDFVVVLDGSGSMAEPVSRSNPKSRWDQQKEQVMTFARDVEKIDTDGISVVLFCGGQIHAYENCGADKVRDILGEFSPRGSTPMAQAMERALALAGKSPKKDFIYVSTDGVPDNEAQLREVIRAQANRQETDDALTILFAQQGDDAAATKFLRDLDDNLKGAKFDIVDAKTAEEVDRYPSTAELIVAAIND